MVYKLIKLMHGFVIVPEDCVTVNQTMTDTADHAGIVTERNGTLPHYLVLSDKPIGCMTYKEEEDLYANLGKIYPEVEAVRMREVKAQFEDGILINKKEWLDSPMLGLFSIPEVDDLDHLFLDTGIIRKEV